MAKRVKGQDKNLMRGLRSPSSMFGARLWLLAVFGGMTRLGSFKSQVPSSRELPSPKPQRAALDGRHICRALVWSLRSGAFLEPGAWGLGLWCAPYSIENSEELRLFRLFSPGPRARRVAVTASALIAAIMLMTGRAFPQTSARGLGFEDYLLVPLRVHLLSAPAAPEIGTTLTKEDVARILEKINRVWSQAGVHFFLESLVEEEAANQHVYAHSEAQHVAEDKWLLELRPKKSMSDGLFHIYYVKHMRNNGIYFPEAIFVKDTASLRAVEGGIDEPLPRVTSHELGHAFALAHRQSNTNLMASGTTGTSLNAAEITRARAAASGLSWIEPAPVVMERANELYRTNRSKEAAALYARIATIRLESEAVALAKQRATR
jgi:hypothetical protein